MSDRYHLWRYLGPKFLLRDEDTYRVPHRPLRLARQCLVVILFVVFVFTLTALNVSFDTTFHKASDALANHEGIYLTSNGTIVFNVPPNRWYWNASQAYIDNATLAIWQNVKRPFDASTWAIAGMMFLREAATSYAEARRDNEENRKSYGYLYILGVRPDAVWQTFFLPKVVTSIAGIAAGSAVSIYVVLPYLLSLFNGSVGTLFFQEFNYIVSFVTACFMVSLNMAITAAVLTRGTQHKRLRKIMAEVG